MCVVHVCLFLTDVWKFVENVSQQKQVLSWQILLLCTIIEIPLKDQAELSPNPSVLEVPQTSGRSLKHDREEKGGAGGLARDCSHCISREETAFLSDLPFCQLLAQHLEHCIHNWEVKCTSALIKMCMCVCVCATCVCVCAHASVCVCG